MNGERRYWQAILKARLIWQRNVAAFRRGEREDSGTPLLDLERECLIQEFDRTAVSYRSAA